MQGWQLLRLFASLGFRVEGLGLAALRLYEFKVLRITLMGCLGFLLLWFGLLRFRVAFGTGRLPIGP